MYEEVVDRIIESMDQKSIFADAYANFSGEGYSAHKIDIKNFHEMKSKPINKRIAFVDGGNAELIGAANFSLNLIRAAYVVYQGNEKTASRKFEVLAFIHAVTDNNEIYYKASFFNSNNSILLDGLLFSSFDRTLMHGLNRAEISSVANAIRRFAELKLAKLVSDEEIADFIVLDGNLQCSLTNEKKYMDELHDSCTMHNAVLTAISKTNSLFTNNGNLLSVVLDNISSQSSWFYHPVVDIHNSNHKAEMFFVKFHPQSKHILGFEILNLQKSKSEEILCALAGNSIDPIFIGYPYGLIEADRVARVSNQERESLKTMFLIKLRNKNIEKYLNSKNAHEILDKISF